MLATLRRVGHSAGKVRFGAGSEPLVVNAKPEPGVRFRQPPSLEPEPAFGFGSAFERVRTENYNGAKVSKFCARKKSNTSKGEKKPCLLSINGINYSSSPKEDLHLQSKCKKLLLGFNFVLGVRTRLVPSER
jgi:hypothetical protein